MATFDKDSRIGFIGAGMVGKSLAVALSHNGYTVSSVSSRSFNSAKVFSNLIPACKAYRNPNQVADNCDVVFITSTDDSISSIATNTNWKHGQGVIHCSGVASTDVLFGATKQGAITAAIHPLQTFSSIKDAVETLPGSTFAIEATGQMLDFLKSMTVDLEGVPIYLRPNDKPLYHASVVMMGGLLTGLAGAVADMWKEFGIERNTALRSLIPMIEGNAATLKSVGVPSAIAGPYVRGDIGTLRKHLVALSAQAPHILPVYCQMALTSLPYAIEKGNVSESVALEMQSLLEDFLGK
jgi:predicted short-subunit dehydrogenase-like oxidoreductase (DUF2520 family)